MAAQTKLYGIKAVFFDVFNTLARFWPPREQVQAQACQEFGILVDAAGIDRGYAAADAFMSQQNAKAPLRTRTQSERDVFFARYEQLVLQGAGADVDLALAEQVWRRVRQIPYGLALFEDVLPSLGRLREQGLRLGVLSNLNQRGPALVKELGLEGVIHFAVTPFDAQAEKPHPTIFRAALKMAGVAPHQAAHVGDQVTSDVEGARAVGIQPVLMDRYRTSQPPKDCPVVHSMPEVEELLKE